jgi:hypothetical protein
MNRAVWSEEMGHSKDIEHDHGKMGFARKAGLMNI